MEESMERAITRNPKTEPFLKRMGEKLGKRLVVPMVDKLKEKASQTNVICRGQEHLEQFKDKSLIIAPNHIQPEGGLQQLQMAPDVFHVWNAVEEVCGPEISIAAKADDGWWSKNPAYQWFQQHISVHLTEGMIRGHKNMLPVKKNPGRLNLDLVREVGKILNDGKRLIIFPEGSWHDDFNIDHEVEDGMAFLAITKGDVPICPVYVKGAKTFDQNEETVVCFGKPFRPSEILGMEPDEVAKLRGRERREKIELVNQEWKRRVGALKEGLAHVQMQQAQI